MKRNTMTSLVILAISGIATFSTIVTAADDSYLKEHWTTVATGMPDSWYSSQQAKTVAENVLKYQTDIGGWAKNSGYHNDSVNQGEWARIQETGIGATFDNGATLTEMRFLAKVYAKIKDERYRAAFLKAVNYIFKAQYPNGGWPQYYPPRKNESAYSAHITYNDNSMTNVMRLLEEIVKEHPMYAPMQISEEMRLKAKEAFDRGVDCMLKTQIVVDGLPTVWCAQHDKDTLVPVGARSYELPSFSGNESTEIVLLLMDIEDPSPEIINAINGAVKWFQEHRIAGIRIEEIRNEQGQRDRCVVQDSTAPAQWGRFHDLETGKAFFCDRDGIKKNTMAEIGINRRGGYRWYTENPRKVLERYPQWASKHSVTPDQVERVENKKQAELLAQVIREQKEIQATLIPGQEPEPISHLKTVPVEPAPTAPTTDFAQLEAAVGLSAEQQSQVSALLDELKEKRRAIEDMGLSRDESRAKMKRLNDEYLLKGGKINAVMTAEQFDKWNTWQEAIRAARKAMQ